MDALGAAGSTPEKARTWWIRPSPLGIAFVGLVAFSIGRQAVDTWSHTPRVIVENRCLDAIDHLIVEGPAGTTDLGRLPPRGRTPVAIEFRPGETYRIYGHDASGDEVVRQLEIARKDGGDAVISIRGNPGGEAVVYLGGYALTANPGRKMPR